MDEAKHKAVLARVESDHKGSSSLEFSDTMKSDAINAINVLSEFGISLTGAAEYFVKNNRKIDNSQKCQNWSINTFMNINN